MNKIILILQWLTTSRFKYIASIVLLVSCFFNYTFNLSPYLSTKYYSQNYLDLTFTIPGLLTILIFIYLLLVQNYKWFRYLSGFLFFFGLFQSLILTKVGFVELSHNIFATTWVSLWIFLLIQFWKSNVYSRFEKQLIFATLILYGFFDHFLISDPQILVFLYALGIFFNEAKPSNNYVTKTFKALLLGFFSINLLLVLVQIVTGRSLGLKYLGELFLNENMAGVARQSIGSVKILRGYGITNHPNILGFFGITGILFCKNHYLKMFWGRWKIFIGICSILLVFTSFSRISWFNFILITLYYNLFKNTAFEHGQKLSRFFPVLISLVSALFALFVQKIMLGDWYRILDLKQYTQSIQNATFTQLLFGIGIGNYSLFLKQNFNLIVWQYMPVHNIFLGLLFEIGLIPVFTFVFWFYLTVLNIDNTYDTRINNLDVILYTTYFKSKNVQRQAELDLCLKHNLQNPLIKQIVLFCDECPDYTKNNSKLVHIKYKGIPIFKDFITHANKYNSKFTIMMANSDIYFDESLKKLNHLNLSGKFLALTRIEDSGKLSTEGKKDWTGNFYSHSQDVWIFQSPLKKFKADFRLGTVACENRLLAEAYFAGLEILNPSKSIKAYHRHKSQIRTWKAEESYHGFRGFPLVCDIENLQSRVQIIWE